MILVRESTFSFWQDAEFNALTDKPLTPEDDAYHPPQPGETLEESWIFEVLSGQDIYLRTLFTVTTSSQLQTKSHLYWWVKGEKGQETQDVSSTDFAAAADRCRIKIGPNEAEYLSGKYLVRFKSQQASGELEFKPEVPGWQPGIGRIAYGDLGLRYLAWQVPVPRATVKGEITIKNKTYALEGVGYHDHRRCNFPLKETLAGAYIGRLYSDQYTLLLADFWGNLLYSGKHILALYIAKGQEAYITTPHVDINIDNSQTLPRAEVRAGGNPLAALSLGASHILGEQNLTEGLLTGVLRLFSASGHLRVATNPEGEDKMWGLLENLTIQR